MPNFATTIYFCVCNENLQKIAGFCFTTFFLSSALFILANILSKGKLNNELLNEYECGFDPFDDATRYPFDIHYYIVGILFLIFDIEIALLFP